MKLPVTVVFLVQMGPNVFTSVLTVCVSDAEVRGQLLFDNGGQLFDPLGVTDNFPAGLGTANLSKPGPEPELGAKSFLERQVIALVRADVRKEPPPTQYNIRWLRKISWVLCHGGMLKLIWSTSLSL